MRAENLRPELTVVSQFVEEYMTRPGVGDCVYARALLQRADERFVQHVGGRKECEACVTELLQFRRALALITSSHPELHEGNYLRDYNLSVAALKRVSAAVRLNFLLLDLQAIVDEQ